MISNPIKINAKQITAGIAHKPEVLRHLVNPALADITQNMSNARPSKYVRKMQIISGIMYVDNLKRRKLPPAATINMSILFIIHPTKEERLH
jgi:hypothetical protein